MEWKSKCPHCGKTIYPDKLPKFVSGPDEIEENEYEENGKIIRQNLRSVAVRSG